MIEKKIIENVVTDRGNKLLSLSEESPIMLVFLRHFGCVFCREAMREIAEKKSIFSDRKVKLVLVHMSIDEVAQEFFEKYNLSGYESISDPETELYQTFGLGKGNFNQLFGLKSLIRGFEASMSGTMVSLKQIGDGFQMPGVFLIHHKEIKASYIHQTAADKPDYEKIMDEYLNTHN